MFWQVTLATDWRLVLVAKNACFAFQILFFKTFSVFPSNFCDCSMSSPFLFQLKLTQTLLKLHFCIISSLNFKKKIWVFSVSLYFSCFECAFLDSVSVLLPLCFEKYHARSRVCFILVSVLWLRVSVFVFITGVYMKFMVCALFHDCVVSFISCLWYFVTLFVIWILVMLSAYLILSYYCSSSYLISYSTYYVSVAYDFLFLNWLYEPRTCLVSAWPNLWCRDWHLCSYLSRFVQNGSTNWVTNMCSFLLSHF